MPLELEKTGDLADDDVVRREAELGAQLQVVGGGEERLKREATEDPCELARTSDSGGQVLLLHGLSHDDEVCGNLGGMTLRRTKQRVG